MESDTDNESMATYVSNDEASVNASDNEDDDVAIIDSEYGADYLEPEGLNELEQDSAHEIIHIITPENRKTSEVLDPAGEMANVLLTRIEQIENGGTVHIDTTGCRSASEIAKRELLAQATPLKIRRIVRDCGNEKWAEEWEISEMVIPSRELKLDLGLLGKE